MSLTNRYSNYNDLASIYDNGKTANEIVVPILEKLILQYIPEKANILDLGCGIGSLMQEMLGKGYQATGIDASEAMLERAKKNTPDGSYILADLRSFKLQPNFHVAISISVLLHIMTIEELISIFQNTYAALLENGWFLFQLEESYHVDLGVERVEANVTDNFAWIIRKNFDRKNRTAQHHYVVFKFNSGEWQRSDVTLQKRLYTIAEVKPLLEEVGFTEVAIYDVERDFAVDQMAGTKLYVCRKSPSK